MTDLFANVAGKVLDLAKDAPLLTALGEFAANLTALRAEGLAMASAKTSLVTVLRATSDPDIVPIFAAAGLSDLLAHLAKLSDFADRLEQSGGGFFLEPLSAFAAGTVATGRYRWDLVDAATTANFDGIGLDFAGAVAVTFAVVTTGNMLV